MKPRALSKKQLATSCGMCRYHVRDHAFGSVGECRRNAPPPPDSTRPDLAIWPSTTIYQWCGQFEAKDKAKDAKQCAGN